MILVDSGVWIDYFNGVDNEQTDRLNNTLGIKPIAAGDLILTEVLQGFRAEKDYVTAKSLFEELIIFDLVGMDMAIKSAENFRLLRKRGITIRKSIDVIIASFCIERRIPLLFSDRDFTPFVKNLGLISA